MSIQFKSTRKDPHKPYVIIGNQEVTAAGVQFYAIANNQIQLYMMDEGKGIGDIGGKIDADKDDASTAIVVAIRTACRQVAEETNGEFLFGELEPQVQAAAQKKHYSITTEAKYCMFFVRIERKDIDIGAVEELNNKKHKGMWKTVDEVGQLNPGRLHPRFDFAAAVKAIKNIELM